MGNPSFVARVETKLLYQRLMKAEVGELVTYEELSEIAGVDIQKRRSWLQSARRKAKKEGAFFGPVVNEGYRRLTHDEAVTLIDPTEKNRRAARRALQDSTHINFDGLRRESQDSLTTMRALCHVMDVACSPKAVRSISAAAKQQEHELTVQKTLELFKGL